MWKQATLVNKTLHKVNDRYNKQPVKQVASVVAVETVAATQDLL